jgi:predicted lipoprotein
MTDAQIQETKDQQADIAQAMATASPLTPARLIDTIWLEKVRSFLKEDAECRDNLKPISPAPSASARERMPDRVLARLKAVTAFMNKNRQCGNTTAIVEGIKTRTGGVVLTTSQTHARYISRHHRVDAKTIETIMHEARGTIPWKPIPYIIDGAAVHDLLVEAIEAIEALIETPQECT